jgi:topoisomerase-4 subunit B
MANDLLSQAASTYDASSIEVLEGLEPVRKRPGMYIGGTDERALHHLVAEILDNAMDEAVAGHANRIEVELHADGSITIRDNGRGMPVDPHPKFPGKSALEVILCVLHAGGKFSNKAYSTSGGLNGVGSSVVNALSDRLTVQVARNKELYEQSFSRGIPQGPIQKLGPAPNRRGTTVTFHPDPEIFGSLALKPARVMKMARSKAYLFSGVEIRWKSALPDGDMPQEATFHFPGGLADYLSDTLAKATTYADRPFAGKVSFEEKYQVPGSVEWAINWTPVQDGFIHSYCNTVPTPEGGTHEAGFWAAILKGIRAYGERVKNRKADQITRDDMLTGGCALISVFIREPFRRPDQGPPLHRGSRPLGRKRRPRPFRHLACRRPEIRRRHPRFPGAARRRTPAPPAGKGNPTQDRHQETAPARQTGRLLRNSDRRGDRIVHRRRRQRRRLRQGRPRRAPIRRSCRSRARS